MNDEATATDSDDEEAAGDDEELLGRAYGRWVAGRRRELGLKVWQCADRLNDLTGWDWEQNTWTQIEVRTKRFPQPAVFRAMVAALQTTEAEALRAVGLLPEGAAPAAPCDLDALVADLGPADRAAIRGGVAEMARLLRAERAREAASPTATPNPAGR